MGSKHKWDDVRLLSFDLQTVEFAYAADYAVSMTCADPLSPGGGSYELRFGRAGERDARSNPHEDMVPFFSAVLRRGPLGRALTRLVGLLRDTLPVVAELEDIQAFAARDGILLDAHAKDAGWHRILYGDLR
jgi:mediator of RNA polymerase II transcription subunit 14